MNQYYKTPTSYMKYPPGGWTLSCRETTATHPLNGHRLAARPSTMRESVELKERAIGVLFPTGDASNREEGGYYARYGH